MNILTILYLHAFLVQFILCFFILFRNPKALLNRVSALFLGCFAFWCLEMVYIHSPDISREQALLATKIFSVFWISSAAFSLLFVHVFVEKIQSFKNKSWLLPFLPAAFFVYQSWQNNLLSEFVPYAFGWYGLFKSSSPWPYLFFFYYSAFCIGGLILLFRFKKREKEELLRKQAGILFIGAALTFLMCITAEFILPELGIHIFEDMAALLASCWSISIVYAINKYQFLPITTITATSNILSAMSDALFLVDNSGRIVDTNRAASQLLDFTKQELLTKQFYEILAEEEKKQVLQRTEEEVKELELSLLTKAGYALPVSLSISIIEDPNQNRAGFVYVARDITEHKRMNKALRESEQRYRELAETLPLAVWEADLQLNFTYVNKAGLTLVGLTEQDIVRGLNIRQIIHKAYWKQMGENLEKLFRGEIAYTISEYIGIRSNGSEFPIRIITRLMKRDGQVVGLVGLSEDIYERRQMEEQVRKMNVELENRVAERTTLLSSLLDSIPDLVFFKDLQGVYLGCNPAFASFAGRSREEIIGKTDYDLFSAEKAGMLHKNDYLVLEQNQVYRNELTLDFNDGRYVPVEMQTAPLKDVSGKVIGLLGIVHDITDARRAAFELKQAKEVAETANQAKSQFLANMSHEIRTPLHGIIGFLKLLVNTSISEEQLEYIHSAQSASGALLHLINELLDFSRIEAAKLNLQPEVFDLRETVEETAFLLSPGAFEKNLELITHIEQGVPYKVVGDQARLKQVLINLIENAIKFTEQGEILVKVKNVGDSDLCRKAETGKVTVQFEVWDTGIGIDQEDGERLFIPFSQLDSSTTRRYGGTGLGLTISKKLIEMMGGQIKLESEKGKGSKFIFYAHFGQAEQPQPQNYNFAGLPVLVVDDNLAQCQVLEMYLKETGCEVYQLHNGPHALQLLTAPTARRFRFILLDNLLPDRMSHLLIQTITNNTQPDACDIIVLNSSAESPVSGMAVEPGTITTLHKPVKKEQLLACLANKLHNVLPPAPALEPEKVPVSAEKKVKDFTILVVEDNELNSRLMVKLLNKWGYRCESAKNGQEAVSACSNRHYDLILMDCQMPVMDGYEATAAIRQVEGQEHHTVIIGLTAHALSGDRDRCLAAGMDEYISKPFDFTKLANMLEHYKYEQSAKQEL